MVLQGLMGLLAIATMASCRTEEFPVALTFRSDVHILATDRGRFLVVDTDKSCEELRQEFETGGGRIEVDGTLREENRDMCDFVAGFEISDWPEGSFTTLFAGYRVDADTGEAVTTLWVCEPAENNENIDAVTMLVGPEDGLDPSLAVCNTVGERCGGTCVHNTEP